MGLTYLYNYDKKTIKEVVMENNKKEIKVGIIKNPDRNISFCPPEKFIKALENYYKTVEQEDGDDELGI